MRFLTDHIIAADPDHLTVNVLDEPGPGGANHHYVAFHEDGLTDGEGDFYQHIVFQKGPIKENGINGLTHEALLAIIIDRLKSFQAGPFPSDYNERALGLCSEALHCLHRRTLDRIARGVEGETKP